MFDFLAKNVDIRKYVRYNIKHKEHLFATHVRKERLKVSCMYNSMRPMRIEDVRSERRIQKNRIRRQREIKKDFLIFIMTICLIATCTISMNGFLSNAKGDSTDDSYKYYKSIIVANDDTLWSIAEKYMDKEHYDSINDYIAEVKNMNALTDDVIHYGEYLIIPYYGSRSMG